MGFFKSTVHVLTLLCAEGLGFSQVPTPPRPTTVQVQSAPIDVESAKHGILKIANGQVTIDRLYDPSKKILLVGNKHGVADMQTEMTRSLSGLHDKGIRNLDLECTPEDQTEIDKYVVGKLSRNGLISYFKTILADGIDPIKEADMIAEALRLKMKTSCVDAPDKDFITVLPKELILKLAGYEARSKKPEAKENSQVKASLNAEWADLVSQMAQFKDTKWFEQRNRVMASKLDKTAQNDGAVAMFVGGNHVGRDKNSVPGFPAAVRRNSIESELLKLPSAKDVMSINLRGGQGVGRPFTDAERKEICGSYFYAEECWAQKNGKANQRYVLNGGGDATYILHLPEMVPAQPQGRAPQR